MPAKQPARINEQETRRLIALVQQNGDIEARNQIVVANLGLIGTLAKKFLLRADSALSLEDLIQEGVFGLIEAISRFDLTRQTKFSYYADYWIKHYLRTAVLNSPPIRVPYYMHGWIRKYKAGYAALYESTGIVPKPVQVMKYIGLPQKGASNLLCALAALKLFCDLPVVPDRHIKEQEDIQPLLTALEKLKPIQRTVVALYFGLSQTPMNYTQIAQSFGKSKEWARKQVISGLDKLKAALEKR
jgi:RNA polymerase sigma factor (sigma-70 family)